MHFSCLIKRTAFGLAMLLFSGCQDITAQIWIHGIPLNDVFVELDNLGRLSTTELQQQGRNNSVDHLISLNDRACDSKHCRAVLVTVFIENKSPEPLPPPVIRLDSPKGKPIRQPFTSSYGEIDPGRTGRIRFITRLWPKEDELNIHLSGSIRLELKEPGQQTRDTTPISP